MKRQELYIEKYDWHILLFLDYSCDYLDEVLDAMDKLKCGSKSYDIAYDNLSSCSVNTGLTFSDYISRTSVIVISITNSEKEFLKSYHHELGHCAVHICQFYGIPLEGEEVQYLGQDLVDRTLRFSYVTVIVVKIKEMKRKEILKAMKAMKSEKPINSMYRMIPKSRMDEFKRFAAIFGFTEENIENILSKEKEMVGK